MMHLHCVAANVPPILRIFTRIAVTVYVRSDVPSGPVDGVRLYPLAPRRKPWEAPLAGTELGWKLEGERSRLDFLLIRNALRDALQREPDAEHVLMSFPENEFVTQRVAEDLRLPHITCAVHER